MCKVCVCASQRFFFRFVICNYDATLWPANGNIVASAMDTMANLLSMSSATVGWLQYPQLHTQTTQNALVKHKHAVDLLCLKYRLTCHHTCQILYSKDRVYHN